MRCLKTEAQGSNNEFSAGKLPTLVVLGMGARGAPGRGFQTPPPPGGILTPGASTFPLLPANQTRLTPGMGAWAAGDSPRLVAGLAEELELVLELLPPIVPPLGPSVDRHTRKNKIIFF